MADLAQGRRDRCRIDSRVVGRKRVSCIVVQAGIIDRWIHDQRRKKLLCRLGILKCEHAGAIETDRARLGL